MPPGQNSASNQTVSSVWALEGLSQPATALLQVLSLLDPERVPEDILVRDTEKVGLPHYPKTDTAYRIARTKLIKGFLVSREAERKELRIHPLLQDAVREKLSPSEMLAVFESVVALLLNAWPPTTFDERNFASVCSGRGCGRLLPHAEKLRSLFEEPIRSGSFQPSLAGAVLFNQVAW
jgi:hypothetical protein